jgi:hypothetical protein
MPQSSGRLIALQQEVIKGLICLPVTNTLAYFGIASVIQGEKFYGETSIFATKLCFHYRRCLG